MFDVHPQYRFGAWRDFRKTLDRQDPHKCLSAVAHYWSNAPLSNQFLAPDLIEDWPDPWHLIYDGVYDDLAIALGMYYTLMIDNPCSVYCLQVLNNRSNQKYIVVDQEIKYAINWHHSETVNISQITGDYKIQYQYCWQDFQHLIK